MAWASPTDINWSNGLPEFFIYINTVTLGWVSRLFLVGIYVLVLSGYYKLRNDFKGALAMGGIAVFLVGLLFWVNGFTDWITFAFCVAIAFLGASAILFDKD